MKTSILWKIGSQPTVLNVNTIGDKTEYSISIYIHMFLSKLEDAPFCGVCGVECVRILGFNSNMLKNHQSKFFIGGFTLKAIITHDGSGWCW